MQVVVRSWLDRPAAPAVLGTLATVLVALGAGAPGVPRAGLVLLGLPLLVVAWVLARRLPGRWQWPVAVLWSLPLLAAPPVLSPAAYVAAEEGFLVLQGLDPRTTGLATRGGPFAGLVDAGWRGATSVAPPGALTVQRLVVDATGSHPTWSVAAMRLPAGLGLVAAALLAPRLAAAHGHDPDATRWAVLLNPVALLHAVGGGHLDALAAGLAVAAVWAADPRATGGRRWGWLVGCPLAGLAASVAPPPALVVVGCAALAGVATSRLGRWADLAARTLIGTLLALAAAGLVAWVSGLGWGGSGGGPGGPTVAPAAVAADLAAATGAVAYEAALAVTAPVLVAAGAGLVVAWGLRTLPDHPLTFLAGAFLVLACTLPGARPWHLLWAAPYAAVLGWFDRWAGTMLGLVTGCLVVAWLTGCLGLRPTWSALLAASLGLVAGLAVGRAGRRPGEHPARRS